MEVLFNSYLPTNLVYNHFAMHLFTLKYLISLSLQDTEIYINNVLADKWTNIHRDAGSSGDLHP